MQCKSLWIKASAKCINAKCKCIQSHLKLSPLVEEGVCTEYMYVYSAHCLLYKSVSMYCLYVNCFCTVWSTLSRISLTNAHVLWWCDNKSDLIWFEVQVQEWMTAWELNDWILPVQIYCFYVHFIQRFLLLKFLNKNKNNNHNNLCL